MAASAEAWLLETALGCAAACTAGIVASASSTCTFER